MIYILLILLFYTSFTHQQEHKPDLELWKPVKTANFTYKYCYGPTEFDNIENSTIFEDDFIFGASIYFSPPFRNHTITMEVLKCFDYKLDSCSENLAKFKKPYRWAPTKYFDDFIWGPDKEARVIVKEKATPGMYKCHIKASVIKPCRSFKKIVNPTYFEFTCHFRIAMQKPVIQFEEGQKVSFPEKVPISLNVQANDINYGKFTNEKLDFSYDWSLTRFGDKKVIATYQTSDSHLVMKNTYKVKDRLMMKVTVKLIDDDKNILANKTGTLEITIINEAEIALKIVCRKNCVPLVRETNWGLEIFFQVDCIANCESINPNMYRWSIDASNKTAFNKFYKIEHFDSVRDTVYGPNSDKFIIKANVLKTNHTIYKYRLTVQIDNPVSKKKGSINAIFFVRGIAVSSCMVLPEVGISMVTRSFVFCQVLPYQSNTRIVHLYINHPDEGGYEVYSCNYETCLEERFDMPPVKSGDVKLYCKVEYKELGIFEVEEALFELRSPAFSSKTKPKEIIKRIHQVYNERIKNNLKSSDQQQRFDGISSLITLLENLKKVDYKKHPDVVARLDAMKMDVCNDVEKSPISDVADVLQMSRVFNNVMNITREKNTTDMSLYMCQQTICRKLARTHFDEIRVNAFPQAYGWDVNQIANKLTECTEVNASPNQSAIVPDKIEVSSPVPTVTGGITENYPDYVDYSEEYYLRLAQLKDATDCALNTTMLTAKVLAMTMAAGEPPIAKSYGKAQIVVTKDEGRMLFKKTLQSQGVSVIPSADWKNSKHPFDILMSTWSKDLMWWNPNKTQVTSDIVKLEFWHSTCKLRVRDFDKPVDLIFKLKAINQTVEVTINDSLTTDQENPNLFRIILISGEMVRIKFNNISDQDELIAKLLINAIPRVEDFAKQNYTVKNNTSIFQSNNYEQQIYAYLAIMINDEKSKSSHINFTMSFTSVTCVKWDEVKLEWLPSCTIGPKINATHLNCLCKSFSVISTSMKPADVRRVVLVVEKDFVLEIQSQYVIFGAVFIVFALYFCILSLYFKQKEIEVYFLADNVQEYDYGYIIIVRTGSGFRASTSSNVVCRLTGNLGQSEPHLLNYPDPQMRMLQRNGEDIFVLTTKSSLGEKIELIEFWYDSIGFNATWYCNDVFVYDIQMQLQWYFKVRKRLCVVKGVTHIAIKPMDYLPRRKCILRLKTCDATHGWLFANEERYLTRSQRLTILLSNVLCTMFLISLTYPWPRMIMSDCIDRRAQFTYDWYTLIRAATCAAVSFVLHSSFTWIIRMTKYGKCLLILCNICWFLIGLIIFTSANLMIIFGFWIPFYTSLEWLLASISGLAISAIVYENLVIFVKSFIQMPSWLPEMPWKNIKIMQAINFQKQQLFELFGGEMLRPYFQHLYSPMNDKQIDKKKDLEMKRRQILEQITDFIMFSIYIVILYIVILMNKSSVSQISNKNMINLMEGKLGGSGGFSDISQFVDVYDYIEETLIPVLQEQTWYGSYILNDPGLMIDKNNKYLGVVRLRQLRMPRDLCDVIPQMEFLNMSCWPEFNIIHEQTGTFSYRWEEGKDFLRFDRLKDIWQYQSSDQTGTLPVLGEFATYGGGGYVSFLGRTMHNSVANFRQFKAKRWIDDQSRCLLFEFLTYNCNHNEFNAITLIFEQSASGYTQTRINVQTARMLFLQGTLETIKFTIFCTFIVWVVLMFVRQSSIFVKKVKVFYKDVWFFVDLFIIWMSAICIVTFTIRTTLIKQYLDKLEKAKHNEFIVYFHLFYMEDFLTIFGAVLIGFATIRMWRFLRFGKVFRLMERTLVLSCSALTSLFIVHAVFLLAFGFSGTMLYGIEFADWSSPVISNRTLLLLILFASYVKYDLYLFYSRISYMFFGCNALIVILMMTFYGIVLMEAYVRAQLQFAEEKEGYSVKHYFQEKMRYWPLKLRFKLMNLKGGDDGFKEMAKLKPGDERFENSISINEDKLNDVRAFGRCIIKNLKKSAVVNKAHHKEMLGVAAVFIRDLKKKLLRIAGHYGNNEESEGHSFYTGHLVGQKVKCIDEQRIELVKSTVEMLLNPNIPLNAKGFDAKTKKRFEIIKKSGKTLERAENQMKIALVKMEMAELKLDKMLPKIKK